MAHKTYKNCLYSSIMVASLLIYQSAAAQKDFSKIDHWLSENVKYFGCRAVLFLFKEDKVIYDHSENELNAKQKFFTKHAAKKTSRSSEEMPKDYDGNTKRYIASCKKWIIRDRKKL